MATVKENLIAAKALIDTPEKWGKGLGSYLVAESRPACAHEACRRVAPADHVLLRRELAAALPVSAKALGVPVFNDDPATTHADVMALFQRAIDAQDGAL